MKPLDRIASLIAFIALAACGGESRSAAEKACDSMKADGVTVGQASAILSAAIADGVAGDELRAECGALIDGVLDQLGDGPLKEQVEVIVGTCDENLIRGAVVNNSTRTVDIVLRYELLNSTGTRLGDGLVTIDALAAGQRARWEEPPGGGYTECRVSVDSVRPA